MNLRENVEWFSRIRARSYINLNWRCWIIEIRLLPGLVKSSEIIEGKKGTLAAHIA
jgi:hypothetical protein